MSILYRAVWSDKVMTEPAVALDELRLRVAAWAQEVPEPTRLVEGQTDLDLSQGRHRTIVYRAVTSDAVEFTVRDQVPDDMTEWMTTIRVALDESRVHILVENSMESDDFARRVSIGRPRIVRELLAASQKPCIGGSVLLTAPQAIPAEGIGILADILADPHRGLPVIVCSEPGGSHDGSWLTTATRIAARSEGIAVVMTLDKDAVTLFKKEFGDLAIWGGGVRVYAPVPVEPDGDGWRHRYYLRSRLEVAPQATIDRIVYSVAQLSTRRRVPDVFRVFTEQSGVPAGALDDMVPAALLDEAREQWEFEMDLALEEHSELQKELARAHGHLARLKDELLSEGLTDLLWGTQHEVDTSIPDDVQDTSEAVLAAQTYLSKWLALPESAARELADIDTAPTAFAWGNNTWRGLRALAAYAEDRAGGWDKGGFWEWCASGPLLGWPATTKKLSMTESESVQNNDKLRRTRVFKVDSAVNESNEITMLAHLKVSEGGGNLAPRIYFHDDTGGTTGMVHVGFIGPHHLVPNKSAN
ncbi:hypothetical protein [Terrabacter sp. 2YAF2]|uniref:hypothetical protein n=1 Tax=Terrabacter sp. 2YAF2 TaxID=3233026 RepID=UPI003F980B48